MDICWLRDTAIVRRIDRMAEKGQGASKANIISSVILLIGIFTLSSCSSGPVPIKAGQTSVIL